MADFVEEFAKNLGLKEEISDQIWKLLQHIIAFET